MPAAFLQEILIHEDIPEYVNYARIGSILGSTITKGFTDTGRLFSWDRCISWWTNETEVKYVDKMKCIMNQYNDYTDKKTDVSIIILRFDRELRNL